MSSTDSWGADDLMLNSHVMLYHTRAVAVTYLHLIALSRSDYETLGEQYPMECALMRRRIIRDTFVADIMLAAHKVRLQRWETGQHQPSTPATTGGGAGGGNGPADAGSASGTDGGGGPAAPVPTHTSSSSGLGWQSDGGDSCASIIADAAALAGTDHQLTPTELLHALKVLTARAADLAETGGGYAEPSQLSLRAPAGLVIMPNGDSAAHTSDVRLYLGAAPEEEDEEDEEDEDVPISSLSPRRSPSPDRRWQAP